jgi:hypothetical protein
MRGEKVSLPLPDPLALAQGLSGSNPSTPLILRGDERVLIGCPGRVPLKLANVASS